jgi:uncharacterized membrane protein
MATEYKPSPLVLAVIGYVALALALPIQEAVLRGYVVPGSMFSKLAAGTIFSIVFLAPILAVCQSAWLLTRRQLKGQSIAAIVIVSPLLFLIISGLRRSLA